jgi:hypothetical protein
MKKSLMSLVAMVVVTISSQVLADPVGGTKFEEGYLRPGAILTADLLVHGGETTQLLVAGDGDGDLDCFVYDSDGDLVDSDTDGADACAVEVTPRKMSVYRFKVVNRGSETTKYIAKVW